MSSLPSSIESALARLRYDRVADLDDAILWLDASWRAAEEEGISEEEFIHWMEVGCWNLAGSPETLTKVGVFRTIAGDRGWVLAKAELDPEAALEQYYEFGPETVIDSIEVMVTLEELSASLPVDDFFAAPLPPETPVELPFEEEPGKPLDFN